MFLALLALLLGTIFYVPYGESAGPNAQFVRVTGVQFAWAIAVPQPLVTDGRSSSSRARATSRTDSGSTTRTTC